MPMQNVHFDRAQSIDGSQNIRDRKKISRGVDEQAPVLEHRLIAYLGRVQDHQGIGGIRHGYHSC